jgi:isoquinoline 1-oxidoreductase alpha subunit
MPKTLKVRVNGRLQTVSASPDTPLLYVLHNELHLHGPRFGCGLAQCGACSVLVDGKEIRSCVTPVAGVAGKDVTTLEGLPALYAQQRSWRRRRSCIRCSRRGSTSRCRTAVTARTG